MAVLFPDSCFKLLLTASSHSPSSLGWIKTEVTLKVTAGQTKLDFSLFCAKTRCPCVYTPVCPPAVHLICDGKISQGFLPPPYSESDQILEARLGARHQNYFSA